MKVKYVPRFPITSKDGETERHYGTTFTNVKGELFAEMDNVGEDALLEAGHIVSVDTKIAPAPKPTGMAIKSQVAGQ